MNRQKIKNALRRINFSLLFLIAFLIFLNYPALLPDFVPIHDTFQVFGMFHYYYSEFFFNNQIVQWLPFETYGMDSHYFQTMNFSPFSYLAFVIGKILQIRNALFLFKISVLMEQLALLVGSFLLGQRLFKSKTAVHMLCIAAVGSTVWFSSLLLNFRVYYLMPFILLFLVLFIQEKKPQFFWIAGLSAMAWFMGATSYAVFIWVLIFTIFLVLMTIRQPDLWKNLFSKSKTNVFWMGLFFIVLIAFIIFVSQSLQSIDIMSPDREPVSGRMGLKTFLGYGGNPNPAMLIQNMVLAQPHYLQVGSFDNTVYMGLLPIVFLLWGILKVRDKFHLSFLTMAFVLIWMSFGGIFASLIYFFPGMHFYRHVGLVYGIVKYLLLLSAAYGFDYFWSQNRKRLWILLLLLFVLVIGAFDLTIAPSLFAHKNWRSPVEAISGLLLQFDSPFIKFLFYIIAFAFIAITSGIIFLLQRCKKNSFKPKISSLAQFFLLLALVCDLTMFQFVVFNFNPRLPAEYFSSLTSVMIRAPVYQAFRTPMPLGERQIQAMRLIKSPIVKTKYSTNYNFAQYDPCISDFRIDVIDSDIRKMTGAKGAQGNEFTKLIGCNYSKIKLVRNAEFFADEGMALKHLHALDDVDQKVLIYGKKVKESYINKKTNDETLDQQRIQILNFSSNALHIKVHNPMREGSWLIYADAFDPGWKARIDRQHVPVYQAYVGFKTIYVPYGKHNIIFYYFDGFMTILSVFFAVFLCLVALSVLIIALMCFDQESSRFMFFKRNSSP